MCSFNRGNIEGTNSSKICIWCLCVYVLCLRGDWFCRLTWQRVDIYVGRVWKCVFACDLSLTVLRWPCVVDRTLKSNYYYYYHHSQSASGYKAHQNLAQEGKVQRFGQMHRKWALLFRDRFSSYVDKLVVGLSGNVEECDTYILTC